MQKPFGFAFHKDTTRIEETRVKTQPKHSPYKLSIYLNMVSVCQHSYSTPNALEQRTLDGQVAECSLEKYNHGTRLDARKPMNTINTVPG